MTIKRLFSFFVIFLLLTIVIPIQSNHSNARVHQPGTTPSLEKARALLNSQIGFFTENKGQWNKEILFMGNTSFGKVAFTKKGVLYQLIKTENENQISNPFDPSRFDLVMNKIPQKVIKTHTILLSFENEQTPIINGEGLLPHYNNYFIGNDSTKWGIQCRNFLKIYYNDIWKGIDLAYFFTPEGIKYEYYVRPEAKMEDLRIKVTGAKLINHSNKLELSTDIGSIFDDNLSTFVLDTHKVFQSSFTVLDDVVSFQINEKRTNETIVIDPIIYSTYLEGNNIEEGLSIAVDSFGNAFITGFTNSSDFPISETIGGIPVPGYDQTFKNNNNNNDVFVVKLNSAGTQLVFSTFLGGYSNDEGYSIAVNASGIYITGLTNSSDFPMNSTVGGSLSPGYDKTYNGSHDIFVVKLNLTGTQLLYSTYIGGINAEAGYSITVDSVGNAFVTGYMISDEYPFTDTQIPGYDHTYNGEIDVFVLKLDPTGTNVLYATFLGGWGEEFGHSIAIDAFGNAYVTGLTSSDNFPMTSTLGGSPAPGYDKSYNRGLRDAFVVKLNPSGTQLLYSTFLGGNDYDFGYSIQVDASGIAYVAGYTLSSDFPMTSALGGSPAPGYDKTYNGGSGDAFVVKLNPSGTQLLFSTYLGGISKDVCFSIVLDSSGIYITGYTYSNNFPMTITDGGSPAPGYDHTFNDQNGDSDIFIVKLNSSGTQLSYSTYLGGIYQDVCFSIALDTSGIYITGYTYSNNFPMTITDGGSSAPGYDQNYNNASQSIIVVKLGAIYNIVVSTPDGHGRVIPFTQTVLYGQNATIQIIPDTGFEIDKILDNGQEVLIANPFTLFNIMESHNLVVTFRKNIFNVVAKVIGGHGSVYPSNQIVPWNQSASVTIQPEDHYEIASITDNGIEKLINNTYSIQNITEDHTIIVIFKPMPLPNLQLSIEMNKQQYCYGDEVVYKVTVYNTGEGDATDVTLVIRFPWEVEYIEADNYINSSKSKGEVAIQIGKILAKSLKTVQIKANVSISVLYEKAVTTLFYASCAEGSLIEKTINITLIRCEGSKPIPYIKVLLLNSKTDSETGEKYIEKDTELLMEVILEGFTPYYKIEIAWGDGEKSILDKQSERSYSLKHEYNTTGIMEIKIHVEDASGKSKEAVTRIRVR